MNKLLESLSFEDIEFCHNVDLSKLTYLKTGGICELLILPRTSEEVIQSINLINKYGLNYKVIGATSNLLFLDNSNYTCLLSTTNLKGIKIDRTTNEIISGSGEMLGDLSRFALLHSIADLKD